MKLLANNKASFIVAIILIWTCRSATGQDCIQKLESANRAYYDGNFKEVIRLLSDCSQQDMDVHDKVDVIHLLINANIMDNNQPSADQYMLQLLSIEPNYVLKSSELVEFNKLYSSYKIKPVYNIGLQIGFNIPNYQVLRYQSYASRTIEPESYKPTIGLSTSVFFEYNLKAHFFLNTGLIYQSFGYSQTEEILEYQSVNVQEKLSYLSIPIGFSYLAPKVKSITPYAKAGMSLNRLIGSKASIDLLGLQPDFPVALNPVAKSTDQYKLSDQRKSLVLDYVVGIGLIRSFGTYAIRFEMNYEFGLNNLVDVENRYSDTTLYNTYSYVPDDFKMNRFRFSIGISKSFVKPIKSAL